MAVRPYRVLLVDLAQGFGGAEVRVLTQARALQGRVANCRVAALAGSALHERLESENIPHELIGAGRADPRLALALRGVIRHGGYQIVDAHNVQSLLWGHLAALLAGARGRVATIHSDYGGEYSGLKGALYEGVLRFNRLMARQYITVTEVLQAKAQAQGAAARSTLIHNAVPVPEELPASKDPTLLAEWGFTPDDFVAVIVARLKPVKGHAYLIEALAQLDDLPRVKLLVVGDGPLRQELEAQAAQLGVADRVRFAGFRQDIPRVLGSVDCLCMASLSEGLPYAILEGASYARPILATAVGGMATLLQDGQTARLVPPRDPAALAEGLRWLATHPDEAQAIGRAAYEMVRRSFSVEAMIDQILDVYDRALL